MFTINLPPAGYFPHLTSGFFCESEAVGMAAFLPTVRLSVTRVSHQFSRRVSTSPLPLGDTSENGTGDRDLGTIVARQKRVPAIARPIVPSPALHDLFSVEDKAQSRGNVLRCINQYVKDNNLQNPDDRRVFRCDEKLKAVLGVDECTIIGISKHIQPHLLKPEDLGEHYIQQAEEYEREYLKRKAREKSEELKALRNSDPIEESSNGTSDGRRKNKNGNLFKPVVLSDDLAAVCNARELTRPEVIKKVWAYIRENKLQKERGKAVKCDALLKKVFGTDELTTTFIMKGITPHLTRKE